MEEYILKVNNVSKSVPGVKALKNVSLEIKKGEVRAFVGENGAGKSTLIKCIMGVELPDEGSINILCDDVWKTIRNPIESKEMGMFANYQYVNIAPELSIAENYFLGNIPKTKLGIVDWKMMYRESKKILDKFEINADPRMKIKDLTLGVQEMITISKISTNENIRLVIFDEPTAMLENDKVEILYNFIRKLKATGVSVIYISHKLEEIMDVCDTVSVLKDGELIATKQVTEVDKDMLMSMMVGRKIEDTYGIQHQDAGEELLRVENLSHKQYFKDISFSLHKGEILGFYGLVGAGRSEIMRTLFGVEKAEKGRVFIKGSPVYINSPRKAIKHKIGFMTENRWIDGLAMPLSIKTNINSASYNSISKANLINLRKERQRAEKYRKELNIRTPSIKQLVKNLSGGNQQKVVIAKILSSNSDIIILDEPTVGVDVGAKQEIYKIMEKLLQEGKGIIMISSYLPEVMGLSDRIVVVSEGKISKIIEKNEIAATSEDDIIKLA
jgi:ribose transport system ATP-binding protein